MWSGNHIGHHCVIGDHCFITSQVGIAGATRIGEGCFLGGKVGITEGLTIGDDCFLSFGVIVTKDLPPGSVVLRGPPDPVAPFSNSRMRGLV
jgi:UDP-3-O-[3-hydroxymyristoyl] glucosamine N-acyltransferase